MNEEYNILNIAYDLIANNPIKGAYDMNGAEPTWIMDMVDNVDEETQTIHFSSPTTGKSYSLRLTRDYAPAKLPAKISKEWEL